MGSKLIKIDDMGARGNFPKVKHNFKYMQPELCHTTTLLIN